MKTPVLLMVYIKPETTIKVVEKLKEIRARKIYISINIPPNKNKSDIKKNLEVKKIIGNINWNCKIFIKQRKNHVNAYISYRDAINWFFKREKEGIVLEDDTVPNKSFFTFCAKMLKRYRNNYKISQICGSSFINKRTKKESSYFFSNYNLCWGYATWSRSIKDYDESMLNWPKMRKNNYLYKILNNKKFVSYWSEIFDIQFTNKFRAWDYIWLYSNWSKNKISIVPKKHLVANIGFVKDATHTKIKYKEWFHELKTNELDINNLQPKLKTPDLDYDSWLSKNIFKVDKIYLRNKLLKFNIIKKIEMIYRKLKN